MAHILSVLVATGFIVTGLARPTTNSSINPDTAGPIPCSSTTTYTDTNQYDASSLPMMLAGSCLGTENCQVAISKELSFTVTVNVGFEFGIDTDEVGAGIDAGVEFSYGTATTESTTITCDFGDYTCSAYWTAGLRRVEGTQNYLPEGGGGCGTASSNAYSVDFPETDGGIQKWSQYACVCPDYSYTDQPYELCPGNCQ